MSQLALAESAEDLLSLWFSPWEGSHESWHSGIGAGCSFVAKRLTYSAWCHALSIPINPPAWMLAQVGGIELPIPRLEDAEAMACFVGAVIWAGTPAFACTWIENKTALLGMMDSKRWREALRWQGTRKNSLLVCHVEQVSSALDLQCIGLSGTRAAVEAHWPGIWSRLRLRFDRALVEQVEGTAVCTGTELAKQDLRHVLGAWRLSAHLARD